MYKRKRKILSFLNISDLGVKQMNKYVYMNEFNYYFLNLIFNIFNILLTFILYENNVFGIKKYDNN